MIRPQLHSKFAFFLLGLLVSVNVHAMQCWIVSGAEKDGKGAFSKMSDLMQGERKVGSATCTVFGSWEDLNAYYAEVTKNGRLKTAEKVFIFQGAHGGPGGSAELNCGPTSETTVMNSILNISKSHPVGTVIGSCYSSDLQKALLKEQAKDATAPSLTNLCMLTNSPFAREGYVNLDQQLNASSRGKNLNQIFANSSTVNKENVDDAGSLSSAVAWNDLGVANYLTGEKIVNYLDVLNRLNQAPTLACDSEAKINFKKYAENLDCTQLSDEEFSWWYGYRAWLKLYPDPLEFNQVVQTPSPQRIRELEKAMTQVPPSDIAKGALERGKCQIAFVNFLKAQTAPVSLDTLHRFLSELTDQTECPESAAYQRSFLAGLSKNPEKLIAGLRLEKDLKNLTRKRQDVFNANTGSPGVFFTKAGKSVKPCSSEPAERLVQEMFGFESEQTQAQNEKLFKHSPAHQMLNAYAKASVTHRPTHPDDVKRWQACENFVFE